MTHSHADDQSSYYLEQLCTIAISGLLGGVCVMLWYHGLLSLILNVKFHQPVLWGGIALLVLVVLRAVTLWVAVGRTPGHHHHDHEHDDEHCHDHSHCHD